MNKTKTKSSELCSQGEFKMIANSVLFKSAYKEGWKDGYKKARENLLEEIKLLYVHVQEWISQSDMEILKEYLEEKYG